MACSDLSCKASRLSESLTDSNFPETTAVRGWQRSQMRYNYILKALFAAVIDVLTFATYQGQAG